MHQKTILVRIVLSLVGLVGIIAGAVIVFGLFLAPQAKDKSQVKVKKPKNANQVVFYDTIGTAEKRDATPPAVVQEGYTVELEVASDRLVADKALAKYDASGIKAYYTPFNRQGKVYYRVRSGFFADRDSADKHRSSLAKAKGVTGQVVLLQ